MNINLINKIIEVQQITLREQNNGLSQKQIYLRFIQRQFYIALPTYQRYLGINARRLFNELTHADDSVTNHKE